MLLDRQTRIEIDINKRTFLDKLFKRPPIKVFYVNRACLSTLIYFSELTLSISDPEETFQKGLPAMIASLANDGPLALKVIAILLLDTDQEPSRSLVKFLGRNLDVFDTKILLTQLLSHSHVEDFMSTTILIRKMSLLKTEELIAFEEKNKTYGKPSVGQ